MKDLLKIGAGFFGGVLLDQAFQLISRKKSNNIKSNVSSEKVSGDGYPIESEKLNETTVVTNTAESLRMADQKKPENKERHEPVVLAGKPIITIRPMNATKIPPTSQYKPQIMNAGDGYSNFGRRQSATPEIQSAEDFAYSLIDYLRSLNGQKAHEFMRGSNELSLGHEEYIAKNIALKNIMIEILLLDELALMGKLTDEDFKKQAEMFYEYALDITDELVSNALNPTLVALLILRYRVKSTWWRGSATLDLMLDALDNKTDYTKKELAQVNGWVWPALKSGRCTDACFWLAGTVNSKPVGLSCFLPIHLLYQVMKEALAGLRWRLQQTNK